MSKPLVQFVAALLLVLHGVVATGPARVLCIQVFQCDAHADHHHHHDDSPCDHHHDDDAVHDHDLHHEHDDDHQHDGQRFPAEQDPRLGWTQSCDCHFHVPIPGGDAWTLLAPVRGDASHGLAMDLAPTLIAVVSWGHPPPSRPVLHASPPDFSTSEQCRGLRTIRLLI